MTNKLITLTALTVLLSACSLTPKTPTNTSTTPPSPTNTSTSKDVFTSIKDAVTRQIALKCEYKDNDQLTTTYIKGQTVRLKGNDKSAGVEGLMKDGKFYLWNSADAQNKKGIIIDISKLDGAKMGETSIHNVDDVITVLQKNKDSCTVYTDSAALFELPSDITFTESPDLFGKTK